MRFGRAAASLLSFVTVSTPLGAQTVRIATFNAELSREGPGLMLRDIRAGDAQAAAVAEVIALARPDVIALQGIDWDLDGVALSALAEAVAERGLALPHRFAAQPNAGLASGLDLDGDGRMGGPGDSQGYGAFTGQGGLAVLSRFPIGEVRDFSALLWTDLPGARLPVHADGRPFPSAEAQEVQRLSSTAHWVVPVMLPDGSRLDVLTFHAAPPVFDGPEDRNGLRNADEIALWGHYLDGTLGGPASVPFVLAGDANLDPDRGEGRREVIRALLADERVQDPLAGVDTVVWEGVGARRVDYVLPSAGLRVAGAGVVWPAPDEAGHAAALVASRHRLVWVDVAAD